MPKQTSTPIPSKSVPREIKPPPGVVNSSTSEKASILIIYSKSSMDEAM